MQSFLTKTFSFQRGFTLMEMLIVVALLGIAASMGKIAVKMMTDIFQQQALMEVHRDTQLELYNLSRDVRNSVDIVFVSSDTLMLRMVNVARGYNTLDFPDLFTPINMSTVTYRYITDPDGTQYLQRRYEFNGIVQEKALLKNKLLKADDVNYMFRDPYNPTGTKHDSVEIFLRPRLVYDQRKPPTFRTEAMKRTPSQ